MTLLDLMLRRKVSASLVWVEGAIVTWALCALVAWSLTKLIDAPGVGMTGVLVTILGSVGFYARESTARKAR
jgi:hypothetical protein